MENYLPVAAMIKLFGSGILRQEPVSEAFKELSTLY